jgi:hypothetical protein
MESIRLGPGLNLYYQPQDRAVAQQIGATTAATVEFVGKWWGVPAPEDLRVYVMTAWSDLTTHAPGLWRVWLAVLYPLWAPRAKRIWPLAGGWEQQFGARRTVGIKPPRLLPAGDSPMGQHLFLPVSGPDEKVAHTTCHETTHAVTSHLKLPSWLKEGLAMVAVERFFDCQTVRPGTLERLAAEPPVPRPGDRLPDQDLDAMAALYARGYWLTRYLDETHPQLLRDLLARRRRRPELEAQVAAACGLEPGALWAGIDAIVAGHFAGRL